MERDATTQPTTLARVETRAQCGGFETTEECSAKRIRMDANRLTLHGLANEALKRWQESLVRNNVSATRKQTAQSEWRLIIDSCVIHFNYSHGNPTGMHVLSDPNDPAPWSYDEYRSRVRDSLAIELFHDNLEALYPSNLNDMAILMAAGVMFHAVKLSPDLDLMHRWERAETQRSMIWAMSYRTETILPHALDADELKEYITELASLAMNNAKLRLISAIKEREEEIAALRQHLNATLSMLNTVAPTQQ